MLIPRDMFNCCLHVTILNHNLEEITNNMVCFVKKYFCMSEHISAIALFNDSQSNDRLEITRVRRNTFQYKSLISNRMIPLTYMYLNAEISKSTPIVGQYSDCGI